MFPLPRKFPAWYMDPNNTTTATQFHAWVTNCIHTRIKSNLVPILQHWNRDRCRNFWNYTFYLWHNKVMHHAWFIIILLHMDLLFGLLMLKLCNWVCVHKYTDCGYIGCMVYYDWSCRVLYVDRDPLCSDSHALTVARRI